VDNDSIGEGLIESDFSPGDRLQPRLSDPPKAPPYSPYIAKSFSGAMPPLVNVMTGRITEKRGGAPQG
jgi:hypothetical protein